MVKKEQRGKSVKRVCILNHHGWRSTSVVDTGVPSASGREETTSNGGRGRGRDEVRENTGVTHGSGPSLVSLHSKELTKHASENVRTPQWPSIK